MKFPRTNLAHVLGIATMVACFGTSHVSSAQEATDGESDQGSASAEKTPTTDTDASSKMPPLPSVDAVVDKIDDLYRSKSSRSTVEMQVVTDRTDRTLKMEQWTMGKEHALIVIREPAREAGTATLRTPEGLWNYAPRADRLIRIPSGLLSENWMGSHFTNDDLVRETSYEEDYETSVRWGGKETDGGRHLELVLKPKPNAPVVYSKVIFDLTAEDWIPMRARYFDEGEVVRTMTFSNVEQVGDRKIPMDLKLVPADKPDEFTAFRYEKLRFGVDVDRNLFSKRGLRRTARRR